MRITELKAPRTVGRMAIFILAGVLVMTAGTAHAQSENATAGNGLAGTWRVTVQLHLCNSTTTVGSPFQSLLTFARGGTLVEDTANSLFYPAFRGPGHGMWSSLGDGIYSASSMAFITVNGVLTMTQRIDQTIVIGNDPNQFTVTNANVTFFDPSGNIVKKGCADAAGERFQ